MFGNWAVPDPKVCGANKIAYVTDTILAQKIYPTQAYFRLTDTIMAVIREMQRNILNWEADCPEVVFQRYLHVMERSLPDSYKAYLHSAPTQDAEDSTAKIMPATAPALMAAQSSWASLVPSTE